MVLSGVHDQELLQLPPIQPAGKRAMAACVLRSNGPISSSFHGRVKLHDVLQVGEEARKTLYGSLKDIREESFDSDQFSLPKSSGKEASHIFDASKQTDVRVPTASTKLLAGRQNQPVQNFTNGCGVASNTLQSYRLSPHPPPEKHRLYHKSHSQREFSIEEKENCLPGILAPGEIKQAGTRNRVLSSTHSLTKLPSIVITRSKSSSQPDISNRSAVKPSAAFFDPSLAQKQRVRKLWKKAGEALRLVRDENQDGVTWVRGPCDVIRPVYSRWDQRRHALAEPERMCMPQEVRERIQKDVEIRRRSMKRKMSKFLTVKLGLNVEEDLIT